nr:unnamed protein product [Callosobruchus analis]
MSGRAKKMIALALNAELQEKIANFKSQNQTNRPKKDEDPEYLPDQMDNSDLSSDGVFSDAENELQKRQKIGLHILSCSVKKIIMRVV